MFCFVCLFFFQNIDLSKLVILIVLPEFLFENESDFKTFLFVLGLVAHSKMLIWSGKHFYLSKKILGLNSTNIFLELTIFNNHFFLRYFVTIIVCEHNTKYRDPLLVIHNVRLGLELLIWSSNVILQPPPPPPQLKRHWTSVTSIFLYLIL